MPAPQHDHGHRDDRVSRTESGSASPLLARMLTVGGGIGLLAALVRASEKIGLFGDRSTEFCTVSVALGCEPDALGSLNPLLGVAGFAMLTAVGAVLMTGVALTRGLWLGLQAAVTFGVVFAHGLVLRNMSLLDTTCSYCLLACAVMIPLFWYTTVHTISRGWLPVPGPLSRAVQGLVRNRHVVLIVWYLLVTALVYVAGGWLTRHPPADGAWAAVALITAATLVGAWTATRYSSRMGLWLSMASAMMMVTAVTEILPQVWEGSAEQDLPLWIPALAAVIGFVVITYFTRQGCAHGHDDATPSAGGRHRVQARAAASAAFGGVGAAAALTTHRLVEGATLALTPSVAVITALLIHSASEGLALAALLKEAREPLAPWLLVSSAGPALGVVVATISPLPGAAVPLLLALVGGVLLRTAIVGLRLAITKRRTGELRDWQIAAAVAVAGGLGVFATLAHDHGGEEGAGHDHAEHAGSHDAAEHTGDGLGEPADGHGAGEHAADEHGAHTEDRAGH